MHARSSTYCKYSNKGLIALGYVGLLGMLILKLITPAWLCSILRLRTLMLLSCGTVIVGSIITFVKHVIAFSIGTSLMGIGGGVASVVFQRFIYESAPAASRDTLDVVYNASIVLGLYLSSTFVYIMFNANVTWQLLLIIPMILACVLLLLVLPLKEGTRQANQLPFRAIFRQKYFPPLAIGLATQFFGSVLGSSPVLSFHQSTYDDLGIARELFVWYIVILGVAILGGLIASYYLFVYLGRRRSLIIGSLSMSVSMGLVAYMHYFYVGPSKTIMFQAATAKQPSVLSSSVTLLFLSSNIFFYYFCFGLRGWLGSSFPEILTLIGSDVSSSPNTVVTFIFASFSPSLLCKLGPAIFVVFSAVALIMLVFVLLLVPETNQMTYATIQDQVWRDHWYWNQYMPRRSRDRVIEM